MTSLPPTLWFDLEPPAALPAGLKGQSAYRHVVGLSRDYSAAGRLAPAAQ